MTFAEERKAVESVLDDWPTPISWENAPLSAAEGEHIEVFMFPASRYLDVLGADVAGRGFLQINVLVPQSSAAVARMDELLSLAAEAYRAERGVGGIYFEGSQRTYLPQRPGWLAAALTVFYQIRR